MSQTYGDPKLLSHVQKYGKIMREHEGLFLLQNTPSTRGCDQRCPRSPSGPLGASSTPPLERVIQETQHNVWSTNSHFGPGILCSLNSGM